MPFLIKLVPSLETNWSLNTINFVINHEFVKIIKLEAFNRDSLLGQNDSILADDIWISFVVPEYLVWSHDIKQSLFLKLLKVPYDNAVIKGIDLEYNSNDLGVASHSHVKDFDAFVPDGVVKILLNKLFLILAVLNVPHIVRIPEDGEVAVQFEVCCHLLRFNIILGVLNTCCIKQHVFVLASFKVEVMLFNPGGHVTELNLVVDARKHFLWYVHLSLAGDAYLTRLEVVYCVVFQVLFEISYLV